METVKKISKSNLKRFAEALEKAGFQVIAPEKQGSVVLYSVLENAEDMETEGFLRPARSAKEHFFPVTEAVLNYSNAGKNVEIKTKEPVQKKRVLFFARPCDAASLASLKAIFSYQYEDGLILNRIQETAVVTVACKEPDEYCFCSAVGLAPASEKGSDLLLLEDGDAYIARVITPKGEELLKAASSLFTDGDSGQAKTLTEKYNAKVNKQLDLAALKKKITDGFNSSFWQSAAQQCLGCGTCAFLCPVCHCFDVVDEARYDGGTRRRNWDACQFELFTLHASGHNPRDRQYKRWRQRLMHKFGHFPGRFELTLCTGCGQCTRACPVGVDIYDMADRAAKSL